MSGEKMREEFEAAIAEEAKQSITAIQLSRMADSYSASVLMYSWWAWKASRAAIEVELPERYSEVFGVIAKDDHGEIIDYLETVSAIKSIGLKIKP